MISLLKVRKNNQLSDKQDYIGFSCKKSTKISLFVNQGKSQVLFKEYGLLEEGCQ